MCPHLIGNRLFRVMSRHKSVCVPCVFLPVLSLELIVTCMIIQHRDPSSSFLMVSNFLMSPLPVWETSLELLSYLTWSRGLSFDLLDMP